MIEHFFHNTHGEWNFILYGLAFLPFIGAWIRSKMKPKSNCPCGHNNGEEH
jgi:hypothetical protein